MTSDSEPVLLVRVFDPMEAEIIVAKLRSSGIETFVRHDALGVVYGLTVDGCGQQDIMVRTHELQDALVALEAGDEAALADDAEGRAGDAAPGAGEAASTGEDPDGEA